MGKPATSYRLACAACKAGEHETCTRGLCTCYGTDALHVHEHPPLIAEPGEEATAWDDDDEREGGDGLGSSRIVAQWAEEERRHEAATLERG